MTFENFDFMRPLHVDLLEHHWTGSYLKKPYGAHYRKYLRILSKKVLKTTSDWAGIDVWCSPIVALAPPVLRLT
jgi:hypothetical protein